MKKRALFIIYTFLGFLGKRYTHKHSPIVIGITGSVGKTSCRMILAHILKKELANKKVYTSPKNFNSELGLIFSIFEVESYSPSLGAIISVCMRVIGTYLFGKPSYDIILLEYGIDHPGDMTHLVSIIEPDYAIFTKLDSIHEENFENKEAVGKEKFILFEHTKKHVYLSHDSFAKSHHENITTRISWYPSREISVSGYCLSTKNSQVISTFCIGDNIHISTNLLGEKHAEYITLGYSLLSNFTDKKIANDIDLEFELQAGRMSLFEGIHKSILIDSTYNAGPESMKELITQTKILHKEVYSSYRLGFILGDMRELGNVSEERHREIYPFISEADMIYTVGPQMQRYLGDEVKTHKYSGEYAYTVSSEKLGKQLSEALQKSPQPYLLLFKGSQNTIFMEEALKQVLKNKEDSSRLPRQSVYWLHKKQDFFTTL